MISRGHSDSGLECVTIARNVHKGHSKSHRQNACNNKDFRESVNVVNLIFQKSKEKKNLNKEPSNASKGMRRGLGILRSQCSQNSRGGDDPWMCRWRPGW
jgi:hypothetical protein